MINGGGWGRSGDRPSRLLIHWGPPGRGRKGKGPEVILVTPSPWSVLCGVAQNGDSAVLGARLLGGSPGSHNKITAGKV